MSENAHIMAFGCSSDEISAYIDGELDLVRQIELDAHFAVCQTCSIELNEQKQFLCSLNSSLKQERDIELPANFAKLIVANAESTVSGVRRPRELYNAIFICAALSLFVLFAMGADATTLLTGAYSLFEQTAIVFGFLGHLVYSIFVGLVIVVRSFATQVSQEGIKALAVAALFVLSAMLVSRKVLRTRGV